MLDMLSLFYVKLWNFYWRCLRGSLASGSIEMVYCAALRFLKELFLLTLILIGLVWRREFWGDVTPIFLSICAVLGLS